MKIENKANKYFQSMAISVTRNCNFSCTHCMSFTNKSKLYGCDNRSLSSCDIEIINDCVTQYATKEIILTGGEPLLVLDEIETLQKVLFSDINYVLMTNGGKDLKNFETFVDRIKVNKVVFSFDKWHECFRSSKELLEIVLCAISKNIQCKIVCVTDCLENLPDLTCFIDLNLNVEINNLARYHFLDRPPKQSHDVIANEIMFEYNNYQSWNCFKHTLLADVNYISGFGFTPCAGAIPFLEILGESSVFSKYISEYLNNNILLKILSKKNTNFMQDKNIHKCDRCLEYLRTLLI